MAKISDYGNTVSSISLGDLLDVSELISTSPDVYQSSKLTFTTLQAWVQANAQNLFSADLTMTADRTHAMDGYVLAFESNNVATIRLKSTNDKNAQILLENTPAVSASGNNNLIMSYRMDGTTEWNVGVNGTSVTGQDKEFVIAGGNSLDTDYCLVVRQNRQVMLGTNQPVDSAMNTFYRKTVVQGDSALSSGKAFAIWNEDTVDVELWNWRNNGDIYMGQDSSLFVNGGIFTINAGDPLNTNNAALTIDSSNSTDVNGGVSFKIIGNNSNEFTISERGNLASTNINGNTILNMLNATNNAGLKIDVSQSELISDEWLQKPTSSAVQYIRNGFDGSQCQTIWAVGSNFANDAVHWVRAGTSGFATVQFFRQGVVGNGFIVGGSAKIGAEDISLQGDTLIGNTGDSVGLYGVTPTARATTGISGATFVANTGTNVHETSTFGGYTIAQVVQSLQNVGILT